jgi:hypothetical protein
MEKPKLRSWMKTEMRKLQPTFQETSIIMVARVLQKEMPLPEAYHIAALLIVDIINCPRKQARIK